MTNTQAPEVQSSGREPAPGALALVQRFLNTADLEPGREDLRTPEQLQDWLAGQGLLSVDGTPGRRGRSASQRALREDAPIGQADLGRALEVREALRALLHGNNGAPVDPAALEALNRAAARARLVVRFGPDGLARLQPDADGVEAAIGRLLAIVFEAMTDGSWNRLKACRSETCRWAFYDASRNRSGAWCTMASCGNRAKARAYRQRHPA
jgi:predicted RNA-binding Zn ribbon-like protein